MRPIIRERWPEHLPFPFSPVPLFHSHLLYQPSLVAKAGRGNWRLFELAVSFLVSPFQDVWCTVRTCLERLLQHNARTLHN